MVRRVPPNRQQSGELSVRRGPSRVTSSTSIGSFRLLERSNSSDGLQQSADDHNNSSSSGLGQSRGGSRRSLDTANNSCNSGITNIGGPPPRGSRRTLRPVRSIRRKESFQRSASFRLTNSAVDAKDGFRVANSVSFDEASMAVGNTMVTGNLKKSITRITMCFAVLCCIVNYIYQASVVKIEAEGSFVKLKNLYSNNKSDSDSTKEESKRPASTVRSGNKYYRAAEILETMPDKQKLRRILTAYTEISMNDIAAAGDRGDIRAKKDHGTAPVFKVPLPLRTGSPDDLQQHAYPQLQTCHDLPAKLPTDKGVVFDKETGASVIYNVGYDATPENYAETEAEFCPVELDPFLPWIHDVFPKRDRIEFVAQNMRRCRSGKNHGPDVERLAPQLALIQPISIQTISNAEAENLAPSLWNGQNSTLSTPRYRLAPHNESDILETRFICRFHSMQADGTTAIIGETLSEFPFNYEYASYRKDKSTMITAKGQDTGYFWTSTMRFSCPLPDDDDLRQTISDGSSILSDGTATLHLDLIPIRTSPRYDEMYLTEQQTGPNAGVAIFDAAQRWGTSNVLPVVEASGRWTNIPICSPPKVEMLSDDIVESKSETKTVSVADATKIANTDTSTMKPHFLSACLWASAQFRPRAITDYANTETIDRLREWIEFHLMVGFDHIYVYDNSGAHTNETSLRHIVDEYPASQITWIDWPSVICSNNNPMSDSAGERSSQYAAEGSCMARYGEFSEWMATFDTDEYFVPMGNYTKMRDVISDVHNQHGANILQFKSSRGKLRSDVSDPTVNNTALSKNENATFLQSYNCDGPGSPKPDWAERAKKQIYRTDFVKHHFIHYSTFTEDLMVTYANATALNKKWKRRYILKAPEEMYTNELTEAVLVHSKTVTSSQTIGYKQYCRYDNPKKHKQCWVSKPNQNNTFVEGEYDESDGILYNCHINPVVENVWVPKLQQALDKRHSRTSARDTRL